MCWQTSVAKLLLDLRKGSALACVSRETVAVDPLRLLAEQMSAWELELPAGAHRRLAEYARLLAEYREANVIGTRDFSRIVLEHLLDSVSCGLFEPLRRANSLVDVGSGGGLPGVPLKIILPHLDVLLLEATAKKIRFLKEATAGLGLRGVSVARGRAEEWGRRERYRNAYDVATVRAVSRLSVVCEYCLPLVRRGGFVVAMKGHLVGEELHEGRRALQGLGGTLVETTRVPFGPGVPPKERNLVIVEKTRVTPGRYPRRPGQPAKSPLGRTVAGE